MAGSGAVVAAEDWIEARSDNFVVYSDAGKKRTRELVAELEKFRFVVDQITPIDYPVDDPTPPLTVFAYDSTRNYTKQTGMDGTAGVYLARLTGPVSLLSLEEAEEIWQLDGREVLLHEYTHHLLHSYSGAHYPRWYDEGFAEFMATIEFADGRVILGQPPVHRLVTLRDLDEWLSVETIVESRARYLGDLSSGLTRDRDKFKSGMPYQYAQGWLLTHMFHARSEFRPRIARYLSLLNDRPDSAEAVFEQAFGMSYRDMDRALREYWTNGELPLLAVELDDASFEVSVRIRPLSGPEEELVHDLARIRSGLGRHGRGMRKRLERALADGFRPAEMHEYLARFHLRKDRPEDAGPHIEALLTDHPDRAAGPVLEMRRLLVEEPGDDVGADDLQARLEQSCRRALAADPDNAEALLNCVRVDLREAGTVHERTLARVRRVRERFPEVLAARTLEIETLIALERYAVARRRAELYAGWSRSRDEAGRFEDLQREIERRAEEAAES